ncbi:unnamed protein product [Fraxinus pennsylvanica]|uniref:Vacuolar protein sorting-associated protein 51 homolog n=1 Tax=Fraxinus pennsylvanica TaxID=56036 RepID=A0AAD2E457_9LAMI|nr:unnamed protein product [Fraxinus pennsylvanica]
MGLQKLASGLLGIRSAESIIPERIAAQGCHATIADETAQKAASELERGLDRSELVVLDIQFLKITLKEIAEDEAALDFLLDEVIVVTAERRLDPTPLEPPILDKLAQAKLAKKSVQSPVFEIGGKTREKGRGFSPGKRMGWRDFGDAARILHRAHPNMGLQKLASGLLGIRSAESIIPERIAAQGCHATIAVCAMMLVMKASGKNLFYLSSYCFQLYNKADKKDNTLPMT